MMDFSDFTESVPSGFLRRKDFGSKFLFGSSTSAFQIEGGLRRDGRRASIFDTFAWERDLYAPYSEDAVNHREHYKEDVKLMKKIGFNAYRFSISWSRILPTGKKESRNQEGIDFYKDLLKNLKDAGIAPMATLVHFDPPQDLEDEYYTFLSPEIEDDFCDYAEICFQEFGDDVKYWTTINEPWSVAYGGYITGGLPPAYQTDKDYDAIQEEFAAKSGKIPYDDGSSICPPVRSSLNLSSTSSATETPNKVLPPIPREKWPYRAAHHQILAHAKAARLYKQKYQKAQKGKIGLNVVSEWFIPFDDAQLNKDAAKRAMDFMLGWFMDPIFKGDYPENMRKYVTKGHLPKFGSHEKEMVKGSYDFVSLNYYTARYVTHEETVGGDYVLDRRVRFHDKNKDGKPIGEVQGAAGWVYGYPRGVLNLLVYVKENYGDPEIYITENGIDDADDGSMAHWDSFHDQKRILYLHDHLSYIKEAIRHGVKIKGHCVWSFLDNLELSSGFLYRFGITYVDYDGEKPKRIPKFSGSWYKYFLQNK